MLVEFRDSDGNLTTIGGTPQATLRDEDGTPLGDYPGELVWVVPETQPAYSFVVDIPEPETLQLTADTELGETPPAGFAAVSNTVEVGVGEKAPPLDGESVVGPELVVFASPDRCPSQSCQPMIDQVEMATRSAGVEWRVVDVFANPTTEGDLEFAPAVREWGLP
ncbi:MAG TPA: hypothetical protein VE569_04915, partial [Acidimicrobiia bacterium]|nr:hypothetical protein [Acidimicrobiia bacterium]